MLICCIIVMLYSSVYAQKKDNISKYTTLTTSSLPSISYKPTKLISYTPSTNNFRTQPTYINNKTQPKYSIIPSPSIIVKPNIIKIDKKPEIKQKINPEMNPEIKQEIKQVKKPVTINYLIILFCIIICVYGIIKCIQVCNKKQKYKNEYVLPTSIGNKTPRVESPTYNSNRSPRIELSTLIPNRSPYGNESPKLIINRTTSKNDLQSLTNYDNYSVSRENLHRRSPSGSVLNESFV